MKSLARPLAGLFLCACVASAATADDQAAARAFELAEGRLQMTAPEGWVKTPPMSRIVEVEFAVPAVPGDEQGVRITIMGAGGSVEANVERWIGQFVQPKQTDIKIDKGKVAGQTVHRVDISGTFNDKPAPFAPGVIRENYRMLGAIIVTENAGQYFVKATGPAKTMAANAEKFQALIESLQAK